MEDFFEFLCFAVGIVVGGIGLIFGISVLVYYAGTKPACEEYSRLTGAEISTNFFGAGCLVKYEGRWVDYDVAVSRKQEIKVTE